MVPKIFILFLLAIAVATVECNSEGDALNAWKAELTDPNNVLQSWDPTLINPCTWFHISCNSENSVTRVDLGAAGLSGPLVPELAVLTNLQYLGVSKNKISGTIPPAFGNLTSLISLGLDHNNLSGPIPDTLGNLKSLRFMRLNSNNLSGIVPIEVVGLVMTGNLRILNISDNSFAGRTRNKKSTVTMIIQDYKVPAK